jgi:hypothetical protein
VKVLRTGHPIADTVANALRGCPDFDGVIGYGILRGNDAELKKAKHYFELDRGYFKPSHYDGYYRISHRGTQQTVNWLQPDYERLNALNLPIRPWRGLDPSKPVLVCPPTDDVAAFFGIKPWPTPFDRGYVIRKKGDPSSINFQDYNYVLTFNSSVGWQALMAGIPCVSDATHSIVGSYFNNLALDELSEAQYVEREKLFATMAAHQFTLSEIEQGKAWGLIQHYLFSSAGMPEKLLPPK